ncbi:MAG: ThuA domain-containing protein [Acidobacteria bacterium]|nr:ThuA domain-containing protein [Acidobacteriota bacterium]
MKIHAFALLALSWCSFAASPVRIVLVAGRPSHGPGAHEFHAGTLLLAKCLRQTEAVEPVVVKGGWPEDERVFDGARTIVLYMDGGARHPLIMENRLETMGRLMQKGVGLVCLHYAVEVPKENGGPQLLEWIGGYYERPYSQNPINDVPVTRATPAHPISRGWESFQGRDEWYYRIRFRPEDKRLTPLLTTVLPKDSGSIETIAWAVERAGGGRGVGFTGGHFHDNWGIAGLRRMIVNAILWSAHVDVPAGGARCEVTEEDLKSNLDVKPSKK